MTPSPLMPLIGTGMALSRYSERHITIKPFQVGYYLPDGTLDVTGEANTAEEAVRLALVEHARRYR